MTAECSRQTAAWFAAHPRLKAGVVAANRWLPLIPFACYPALLIWLGLKLAAGQTQLLPAAVRAVLVPAAVFLGGTALRRALNFPRPYQQPGFVPLVQKERQGCSFPSRHALSAGVIAAVWLYFSPAAGAALTVVALVICGLRVLTGVHFVRDVAAGVTLGFALGLAGMWLL